MLSVCWLCAYIVTSCAAMMAGFGGRNLHLHKVKYVVTRSHTQPHKTHATSFFRHIVYIVVILSDTAYKNTNTNTLLTGYLAECVRNGASLAVAAPGMDGSPYRLEAPGGCGGILYGGLTGFGGGTGL